MNRLLLPLPIAVALLWSACSTQSASPPAAHQHAPSADKAPPPLYTDLGTYQQKITTASPQAQAYFDQGLRLVYSFNHLEAQRAFREAARLDPTCAMCYWGIALTYGSNYNSPTDAQREDAALAAVGQARALSPRATERERAVIAALAARHGSTPNADRAALDRAYADAMRDVARRFPDDLDAATLFADAMMNLRPWDLWTPDGKPEPGTEEIVVTLERVLAANPNHPGANHLYIHAVEASPTPERAVAAADRLGALMPGAGHLVHMPSHIYYRVGRYEDAVAANVHAVKADRAYFAVAEPSDIYRMMYYPHNLDFIWHAASMEGRSAETVRAAREFAAAAPTEMILQMSDMETAPAAPLLALARFGRWDEILREPAPPAGMPYVTGVWRYARGVAFAATGRPQDAARELARARGHPGPRAAGAHARRVLQDAGHAPARRRGPGRRDRRARRRRRDGGPALRAGGEDPGRPLVHRAAALVLSRAPVAGRGAAGRRASGGGGGGVSRGSQAESRERLVALRPGPEPAGAGQDGGGGPGAGAIHAGVGARGRDPHGVAILAC